MLTFSLSSLVYGLLVVMCDGYCCLRRSATSRALGPRRIITELHGDITTTTSTLSSILTDVCTVKFNLYEYAFSGAVAGGFRALSRGLTFPLDTLKTVKQVKRANKESSSIHEFTTIDELFNGVVPAVLSAIPANAVFFVIYNYLLTLAASEPITRLLATSFDGSSFHPSTSVMFFERLLFSSIATLPSNLIKTPAELLKQRAQVQPDATMMSLIEDAIRPPEGLRGLFLGNNAQLLRELPYNAIQMATFDFLKDKLVGTDAASPSLMLSHWGVDLATFSAGLGFVAAGLAAALTQPADTVKTRLMAGQEYANDVRRKRRARFEHSEDDEMPKELGERLRDGSGGVQDVTNGDYARALRPLGIVETTKQILDEEGWPGLFVGVQYRVALVSFGGMIYFWTAELARQLFDIHLSH